MGLRITTEFLQKNCKYCTHFIIVYALFMYFTQALFSSHLVVCTLFNNHSVEYIRMHILQYSEGLCCHLCLEWPCQWYVCNCKSLISFHSTCTRLLYYTLIVLHTYCTTHLLYTSLEVTCTSTPFFVLAFILLCSYTSQQSRQTHNILIDIQCMYPHLNTHILCYSVTNQTYTAVLRILFVSFIE